jgi:signal peptidase II
MTGQVQSFAPAPVRGPRAYLRFWVTLAAVLAADQASKAWVMRHIPEHTYFEPPPIPVIDGFFYFVNVSNTGAAWGMFANHTILLALLGVAALGSIFYFRRQLELPKPLLQYTFGMLCGGIIGNLIDREVHGQVVDFWDFHLWHGYRFPAFNVADSFITIGVGIYLLYSFRDCLPGQRKAPAPMTTAVDSATKTGAN